MTPRTPVVLATTLAVAIAAAFGGASSQADVASDVASAPTTCSAATLKGTYHFYINGSKARGGRLVPYVEIGRSTYDGRGRVETLATGSLPRRTERRVGRYSMSAGCRGEATYAVKAHTQQLYADPSGENTSILLGNPNGPAGAVGGDQSRVSAQSPPERNCSNRTLTGSFRYQAYGVENNGAYGESGFENYDGRGHLTNTYTDSGSHKAVNTHGTYKVARNCTATATYDGGDRYRLYIAADGSTFTWLQTKGVRGADFFAGKEHRLSMVPNYALAPKRPRT